MSHTEHHHDAEPAKSTFAISSRSALLLFIVIAGLFIAAVNFVEVMSHDAAHGGHDAHATTEQHDANGHGDAHATDAHDAHEAATEGAEAAH